MCAAFEPVAVTAVTVIAVTAGVRRFFRRLRRSALRRPVRPTIVAVAVAVAVAMRILVVRSAHRGSKALTPRVEKHAPN